MGHGSVRIRSPEVLARFRRRYIAFDEQVRSAMELVARDIYTVTEWLDREQLPYWRRQLRVRDDEMKKAKREYMYARYGDRRMGKPSCIDERKAYEKARRRYEEAEKKVAAVQHWLSNLEHKTGKLRSPVKRLETLLDALTPKAVARLDHMMGRLEEYLTAGPADPDRGRREGKHAPNQSTGATPDGGAE